MRDLDARHEPGGLPVDVADQQVGARLLEEARGRVRPRGSVEQVLRGDDRVVVAGARRADLHPPDHIPGLRNRWRAPASLIADPPQRSGRAITTEGLEGTSGCAGRCSGSGLLAFPGIASATVSSSLVGGPLTVSSDAADAITSPAPPAGQVNAADPGSPDCAAITAITSRAAPAPTRSPVRRDRGRFTGAHRSGQRRRRPTRSRQRASLKAARATIASSATTTTTARATNGGEDGDDRSGTRATTTTPTRAAPAATRSRSTAAERASSSRQPSRDRRPRHFDRVRPDPSPGAVQPRHRRRAERLDLNANGGDDT